MSQFVEQRSARAALVSSGIVASVTALMMKGLNQPLKVSLPLGVATAIGLDYWMAVVGLSELVWVRPLSQHSEPARVVARLGATVVAAEASVWTPLIVGYLRNDMENLGTVVREGTALPRTTLLICLVRK